MTPSAVEQELSHRRSLWSRLIESGGPRDVAPRTLRELGIYGGAQGVWVDRVRTRAVTPSGVTMGLLHTGSSYADDLSADGVIYHYPKTHRHPNRDLSEVNGTKAAGELGLPVFVITYPTPSSTKRNVHLGWVEGWDDESRLFLVSFGGEPPKTLLTTDQSDEAEFVLTEDAPETSTEVVARPGQRRFKFRVLQRYGSCCAVCGVNLPELLDAAHLLPKCRKGTDDPRNGLVLCALHHRAFDCDFFCIEPGTLAVVCRPNGPNAEALMISRTTLQHLERKPHPLALTWAWERYGQNTP